ncbi:Eco57I restriction-modification methylase domain-containing protein [Paenibacillus sp. GCM10012303]|uniref:Eco57I restriction-modification methylase domain-containing protein n=1 Tax=Paenibacillus sp. GCM10012303 TaxID=3317340 RepID=UPI0036154666
MSRHTEWLSLIEISGPFLTVPLLEKVFPQGMESLETPRRARLRSAYDEWREAIDDQDSLLAELHSEWIWTVLTELLEYDSYSLISNSELSLPFSISSPEKIGLFMPKWIVKSNQDEIPRCFITSLPPETSLETIQHDDGWPNSVIERMTLLCRSFGVRLGLVTNGERWVLINAPVGETSSHVSWYSRLWFQEPITLKAFQSLLGVRRCFGPQDETLDALLEESLKYQDDVTDTLGEQVRRAVEVLIQCLDKADQDRNRELLHEVATTELYEAGLTVMMRLVFLLCAEERGLLLLGDHYYDQHYAISTLRSQLVEEADRHGPEMLERRYDAWARILAVFRMVFGGVDHESLRMPALGSSLFDPDRFPFLEGRPKETKWLDSEAKPLPIDNRTVLLLLESLQILQQHGGALLLSYRALDVEQIGHVYEGLLEQTVTRLPEVTLGLIGSQKSKYPNVSLRELEMELAKGERNFLRLVTGATGRSEAAIRNAINRSTDEALTSKLLVVCGGDVTLAKRILPFMHLIRTDAWNDPIVYLANAFVVNIGVDRRDSGTHYTPNILTEEIVVNTLESIVYTGPLEGKRREEWEIKSPQDILNLKICDPTMGSGAFLVQACRWLSERLVESWSIAEKKGQVITIEGEIRNSLEMFDPIPTQPDERLIIAKRLIAEKCLYGVDLNPMAVELAKLSIWLITMAKGRPFGFLDHNLRNGDSLLGIHNLEQLFNLSLIPTNVQQIQIFQQKVEKALKEAIELRQQLRKVSIRDISDVAYMFQVNQESRKKLEVIQLVADAMVAEALRWGNNATQFEAAIGSFVTNIVGYLDGSSDLDMSVYKDLIKEFTFESTEGTFQRKPFHWPLEFPEVFVAHKGFDAIVGNPPFLWGSRISSRLGERYRDWLLSLHEDVNGNADLCTHFFRRINNLIGVGSFGLIGTNSICQTDNRTAGLVPILSEGSSIIWAISDMPWPGRAVIHISKIVIYKGKYNGVCRLDGKEVDYISSYLDDRLNKVDPFRLSQQSRKGYKGVDTGGLGFVLTDNELLELSQSSPSSLDHVWPLLNGNDFLRHHEQKPTRMIINFSNMTEVEARKYPMLMEIVEDRVFPYRQTVKRKARKLNWWLYNEACTGLYTSISKLDKVLVNCVVSKHICFSFMPTRIVFTNALNVFSTNKFEDFAILQSSFHDYWARYYGSSLRIDNRYNPTDCFETFPFPEINHTLGDIGLRYYEYRSQLMKKRKEGLTEIYNLFHDPNNTDKDIVFLRELHIELDTIVANAYGWNDVNIAHGFFETKQGIRFTIPSKVRSSVHERLLELNHLIYKKEAEEKSSISKKGVFKTTKRKKLLEDQLDLFD